MPAAQPSKSSVSNVISALLAAGLQPGGVRVNADGSFCVDVAGKHEGTSGGTTVSNRGAVKANDDDAPSWEDGL